jgi:hypothetical protein
MKAAIKRLLIFFPAAGAKWKGMHRSERPVIREAVHERETRAAVSAAQKRIAEAAVFGIPQIL